jgi:serine/threonine protein kinase
LQEGIMPTTLREITILRRLNHENVIRLLDVVQGSVEENSQQQQLPIQSIIGSRIMLVLEFVEMDLKQFLSQQTEALPMKLVKVGLVH